MMQSDTAIKLDILSDPICPWCYLGKVQLDQALTERPAHPFTIEWHPFQLHPDMPPEGVDRQAYLISRMGEEGFIEAEEKLQQTAAAVGAEINLEAIHRIPNTLDAHRLIHWAGLEGVQPAVVCSLFRANFVEGRDIGDREVLADIADSSDMDASVVMRLLESDADKAETLEREEHSRKMGVNAVPTFIVANRHAVPGAQPADLWLSVIDEIAGQLAENS